MVHKLNPGGKFTLDKFNLGRRSLQVKIRASGEKAVVDIFCTHYQHPHMKDFIVSLSLTLKQWFSAFPMLRPFNTVPHVVVTPNHKIIFIVISYCIFATVLNHSANTFGDRGLPKGS